jgi:G3E family GTPase
MTELEKIPILILTGFLGSGKTTLLNRLLADGVKTAVIINEFGQTPIDQDLLEAQDIPMTVLSGGCLCCRIKGALAPTLKNLRRAWDNATPKPFERVIIETSGVASPEPVIDTLLRDTWLAKRFALNRIITSLAIPFAADQLARHPEAQSQVVWADTLLLTHADLAQTAQYEALSKYLSQLAPVTPTWTMTPGQTHLARLLDKLRPAVRRLPKGDTAIAHPFHSVSIYLERTPSWPVLQEMLQELLAAYGNDLVRIKGVIYPPERSSPLAVQATGGYLYPPQALPMDNVGEPRSRLVLIAVSNIRKLADELINHLSAYLDRASVRIH